MRVIQTKNDTIRLIFNPKTDGLCLSDFLIVRDGKDNFLAQIVEIYDDKFNQEENVAVIKLVYRILPDYQVVPYDNFTPSRECEIAKIKPEEIEKCLNIDKTTVPFGISTKNNRIVNVNLDFFNNNPVVFADKLDEVNCAFENIAQKLKSHKKVVAIDYTGNLNIKNSKRIKALEDFKLPLDYYSLDYIWEKALKEISLEAESELEDMFVELKKFVDSTEDKYIPFPRFIKVIEQQYKATPAAELKLLLTRLKRYWNEGLFSRSKKEFQTISKALQKENAVIIDFSNLKLEWHKEFLEFAVRQIRDYDSYLLLRLNENNSNPELINNLYLKNPKVTIIPSISYGFVKMPQVMEYARNYILYKTLNPRRDFGFANFQIAALNSSSFLIFGKDTMDFMFTLKNYIHDEEDLKKVEDKKIYIDLNLELEEMTSVELLEGNFDLKNVHIQNNQQKRLADEVAIDDILPGYEQNHQDRQNETKNEAETITDDTAEQELQDVPLVDEEAQNSAEESEAETVESIETEVAEADVKDEDSEKEAIVAKDNENLDESETESEVNETLTENKQPDKEQEAKEAIPETSVAELIEASLKNDEEYIKGISKDEKKDEIPLNEDDLDYFVNPEAKTDEEDEVITSEMITEAVDAENLADAIEAQTKNAADEIKTIDTLKKNSKSDDEKVDSQDNALQETAKITLQEEIKEEPVKTETVSPVAEPEMIKESLQINNKEEQSVSAPAEQVHKEDAAEFKESAAPETEQESDTLENIKEEAHSVLEQESVQKALEADLPEGTIAKESAELKAENPPVETAPQGDKLPVEAKQNTQIQPAEPIEAAEQKEAETKQTPPAPAQSQAKKKNPDEAIIIVKEKPNLLIDDFSEPENKQQDEIKQEEGSRADDVIQDEDGISLKELAQKSIETRFDEVISEAKKPVSPKKKQLKINDNIAIDIDSIKTKDNSTQSALPIFNNNEEEQDIPEYDFQEGMRVSHEKYGAGSILKVVKYSNRCLLQIEFEETGKRLLDPKIAKIKPV